jgi:hypothetical protein
LLWRDEGTFPFLLSFVQFLVEFAVDGADFWISYAVAFAVGVEYWVDVKSRRRRLAGQDSDFLDELLLQVCSEIILGSEEHNTTLGD